MNHSTHRTIQLGHILLREPDLEHALECYRNVMGDAQVTRYLCQQRHQSVEQTEQYLQQVKQHWQTGKAFSWGVYPHGAQYQGTVSITPVPEDPSTADLSIMLARAYWGYGIGGRLLHVVEQWLNHYTDVYALNAYCHTENESSHKLLQHTGFIRKARLKDYAVFPNLETMPQDCYFFHKHLYQTDG